jgi:hypothetical protein
VRVDDLLASPRALAFLALHLGAGSAVGYRLPVTEQLAGRSPLIPVADLADPVELVEIAVRVVDDWPFQSVWREDDLRRAAPVLRAAAEQLARADAVAWWDRPLGPVQTWASRDGEPPSPQRLYFDPSEFNSWCTRPRSALYTSSPVADVPSIEMCLDHYGEPPPQFLWQLPVDHRARIYEVHRPADWALLCARYPKETTAVYGRYFHEWGLPAGRIVTPDWAAVAGDWDGVRMSMAGVLCAEGVAVDLPGGASRAEGWHYERTAWFRWVFDTPRRHPGHNGQIHGSASARR